MRSMRWVTRNPPAILIVAIRTDIPASTVTSPDGLDICNNAPITIMPEIALVTLISGVCNAGVTFQITW